SRHEHLHAAAATVAALAGRAAGGHGRAAAAGAVDSARSLGTRMRVGVLTGTATYALPGFESRQAETVTTRFGQARVTPGAIGDVEVVHVSRHLEAHQRLINHVSHRANVAALRQLQADCV